MTNLGDLTRTQTLLDYNLHGNQYFFILYNHQLREANLKSREKDAHESILSFSDS